jgi:hypothetical protein
MSLVLRVEFRPGPDMDDYMKAVLAADNLVALAHHFPDMVFTICQLVASVQGHDMYAHPRSTRASVLAAWELSRKASRPNAYECEHCEVSSPKELWGPGRITCPSCGRMANAADGSPRP